MPAFYSNSLPDFCEDSPELVLGHLTRGGQRAGFLQQHHAQTASWEVQIGILRQCSCKLLSAGRAEPWHYLLEYPIPRRGRRIDAVLIAGSVIIVIEFKCGERSYPRDAISQVEDYCLDLADFHVESRGRTIIPFLVATDAPDVPPPREVGPGPVKATWGANANNLGDRILAALGRLGRLVEHPIDVARWDQGDYAPTPTIIEAAQALYAGQNVREISRCSGGIVNLTRTTDAIIKAVEEAGADRRKRICFVTGVPGAGKTLAGLNVVHNRILHEGDLGVFLSGNTPLVSVLTEALARDAAGRQGQSVGQARRRVKTFIQNVHRFIDEYYGAPDKIPVDKVVVFDEAQRAWDAAQSERKFGRQVSEPEILLEIMDRHPDWSVIVALVGGGQEINRGEAGLSEWGRAILARFRHWEVFVSPELKVGMHHTGACLFPELPSELDIREDESLHLRVNLRSFRAQSLSEFVDALLRPEPELARSIFSRLGDFPLVLTRDPSRAKEWLRRNRRGLRRIGLVASSGARRLRAHGLDVTAELDVESWLLNGRDDVRSSHYLEMPATEFAIQGLELDWSCLCWGGDLHPSGLSWNCRAFRGTRWVRVSDPSRKQYIVNKYRVLLTRARQGMVIWVPPGDPDDPTRPPIIYDSIADYLARCGIPAIESAG